MIPAAVAGGYVNSTVTSGTAGGRIDDFIQQKPATWNGVSGAQTITMDSALTVGNSVLVEVADYQSGSNHVSAVTIAGTTATKRHDGVGTAAKVSQWVLDAVVNSGRTDVVLTPGASGTYLNACATECPPIVGANVVAADANGSSTTPNFTTSGLTDTCEAIVSALWRDNNGVNNVAGTPVTPPLVQGFFVADGINSLGGASGHKLVQRAGTQTGAFASSPSATWFGSIAVFPRVLPCVLKGQAAQPWAASDNWSPTSLGISISASGKVLVGCGGWWGTASMPMPLPSSNVDGSFTSVINPTQAGGGDYVYTQFSVLADPTTGAHTITLPDLQNDDDGYFVLLEFDGVDTANPVRDSGHTHDYHTPSTPPDPSSYETCTVVTDGSAAQVGDFAIAQFVMDPNSTSNSNIAWVPPAGWYVLANKFNATDNVGYLLCVALVTSPGTITAIADWTDNATFVRDASILILRNA